MPTEPALSIVIPLCNEEATLSSLFEQIAATVETNALGSFEVIFVDDGSTDGSWKKIEALKQAHPEQVVALRFRRNHGKAAALSAGIEQARGDIIFTMDADLQDEPAEIPSFLAKLDEGYDCVSGWKQLRKDPLGKTLPSRFFNAATRATSGVKIHDFNCGFKAYRAEAIHSVELYGELHRYIPVLLAAEGFTTAEIPVEHHRRTHGVSKYGWKRLFKGGLDLITVVVITRYLKRPGHFFGGFGMISGMLGFLILASLTIEKLIFGHSIGQRPLLQLGILLVILGVQLISTGLIGELINFNSKSQSQKTPRITETL
ncbi:glycosyltransferase family 2 protein [Coraliomargarita sp. SDUM461003]|uniref:Glycosyltransferase family 2 protein n=1 Tax=Thalassobacterium maritimum TaxID=3041265 RepID=A0ABU1APB8_9BACT|nr:glycosyltransferase family 2 protein [Coraliomargarita sp. SDUM461003]MBT63919.1 glycosyltransferase [Puniceicoccaceae bacterium]MDQ8206005.1 glycosyltransferase family 2 protein [Coraliomargarita sp. SDUM461003]|tara:strand:- start:15243 stop:16190 length:948 start_codon:yes stop_codon:yes gene_type:complete